MSKLVLKTILLTFTIVFTSCAQQPPKQILTHENESPSNSTSEDGSANIEKKKKNFAAERMERFLNGRVAF
jgi:hypothetical protein